MAKKAAAPKPETPAFSEAVMVFTKSSSHWYGLLKPEVITIEDVKFLRGTQVTGKDRHRMQGKRTLIPLEHVASMIEFASEDDMFSEPQPRSIRPPEEASQSTMLTSHEHQHQQPHGQGGGNRHQHHHHGGGHRHGRHHGRDRFQGQRGGFDGQE